MSRPRTPCGTGRTRFYTPPMPDPAKASEGRFIPNRMEDSSIMQRVSRDLYASPTSGLREILANEITAARAAKRLGADPRIEVTIMDDRIAVWGMDSLGIDRRTFDEIYTVLGRSGNFDGKTPGQFGLGRSAYVTISDHMLLETHHRGGDRYTALGVEGRGFQVDLGEPDIPFGTRITMAPRNSIYSYSMRTMVESVAGRCEIPITIVTDSGARLLERRPLFDAAIELFTVDLPDAEIAVGPGGGTCYSAFLCGMPIACWYKGAHRIDVTVDIHDERKYPPTPDRERLTDAADNAISALIDREIDRRLAGFPTDINEALAHPAMRLAYSLGVGPAGLNGAYATLTRHGRGRMVLGEAGGGPILACRSFVKRQTGAVLAEYPNAVFVRDAPAGLTTVSEFMKSHGMRAISPKGTGAVNARGLVTVHTPDGPKKVDPVNPPEGTDIIRVADAVGLKKHRKMALRGGASITIHGVRGAVSVGEFTEAARGGVFTTSRGTLTGAQILSSRREVRRTRSRPLLDLWGGAGQEDGGPPVGCILVHDDGTVEHERAYGRLMSMSDDVHIGLDELGWGNPAAIGAYLRLESPVLRRVMRECKSTRTEEFCREFLELEGKELLPP